jgi:oligosaccharide 4-alpha-D-glucosyltransferase
MKKLFYLLPGIFFFLQAEAQKQFKMPGGAFNVYSFSDNIIKVVYKPQGYLTNENVSDAVIIKPTAVSKSITIAANHNILDVQKGSAHCYIQYATEGDYRGFTFPLSQEERIYGAGERAVSLNRRGYRFNLYNNPWYGYGEGADNLNYSVPFITSSKGYGLFFDNPAKGFLDIGKKETDRLQYGTFSGELNVYIIFGNYSQVLQSYYKLTGTQPLPPKWAFGNFMSRFGYSSESQVKEILSKMQKEDIPVDAIIIDLFWFGDSIKGTLGNLDWMNRKRWPDPKGMISGFRRQGINTILVTEPFFVETSKNYAASRPYLAVDSSGKPYYLTDFYFGHGGLIDIFRNDAQDWFWRFYKRQMENGVEAWWGDLGEPEKHPSNLYHNMRDYGYHRLFKADEVHNFYGHTWTKMLYNHFAKEYPDKRLFSLNRSGFAGTQHYGIFPWTGDVSRSWSGFRAQLPILLGMSMSGVPYVHSDAGGYAGGDDDNELYMRWLQFAVFTPIFRPHATALYEMDPSAKSFPSEPALIDTPFRGYARQAVKLRYELLDYNYSLAYEQAQNGKPLMAPLYYPFSHDTTASKIEDEYMWGENFLVAPVIEKGAKTRKYYLPAGKWYELAGYKMHEGRKWYVDTVSLTSIPVFIREGSFIPLDDVTRGTNVANAKGIKEVVYLPSGKSSRSTLFDDNGHSKLSLEKRNYNLVQFGSTGLKGKQMVISIRNLNSDSKRPFRKQFNLIVPDLGVKPSSVTINNKPVKYTITENVLVVNLSYTGKRLSIVVHL